MKLPELRRDLANRITMPAVAVLAKCGITPNALTLLNLALNILAAYVIATGHFLIGGVLVLAAGLFDILDGALARFIKQGTKFGAILDSTVDRMSEAAIICGLLLWYIRDASQPHHVEIVLLFTVLVGSFLVSYIKARAEGLGLQCQVGLFTRTERVIVLAAGLLINQVFIALCVLAVFVFVTAAQRLFYLKKQTRTGGE